MSNQRDLQEIFNSGEVTLIKVGGVADDNRLLTKGEIVAEIGALGSMLWKNVYLPGREYKPREVVVDSGWTMIANKLTTEKPAPQATGPRADVPSPAPTFSTLNNSSVIYSGHIYKFAVPAWITKIEVFAPSLSPDTNYRVLIVDMTDPNTPLLSTITDPILKTQDWATVWVGESAVTSGKELYILVDALDSGADTLVTGGWVYEDDSNNLVPPSTGSWTRSKDNTIAIHYTDLDSTDRESEIRGMIPGTTVLFAETAAPQNFREYVIEGAGTHNTTYMSFPVSRIADGGNNLVEGVTTTMTARVPVPQPTEYVEEVNYWLSNPAPNAIFDSVKGHVEFDGVPQAGKENNAYGIRLTVQEAVISDDWDFVAQSDVIGAGGTGGSGSELATVQSLLEAFVPKHYHSTVSLGNTLSRAEIEALVPAGDLVPWATMYITDATRFFKVVWTGTEYWYERYTLAT